MTPPNTSKIHGMIPIFQVFMVIFWDFVKFMYYPTVLRNHHTMGIPECCGGFEQYMWDLSFIHYNINHLLEDFSFNIHQLLRHYCSLYQYISPSFCFCFFETNENISVCVTESGDVGVLFTCKKQSKKKLEQ